MKLPVVVLVGAVLTAPALAQEPAGCDKFKWPLDQEQAMLANSEVRLTASGGSVASAPPIATRVRLVPLAEANLPMAPEHAPKSETSFAGFVKFLTPPRQGTYKVSLSSEAWIDVVQGGHFLKSGAHSSARGCEGIRKSVKFNLTAAPFVVQLSDVKSNSIGVAITGD